MSIKMDLAAFAAHLKSARIISPRRNFMGEPHVLVWFGDLQVQVFAIDFVAGSSTEVGRIPIPVNPRCRGMTEIMAAQAAIASWWPSFNPVEATGLPSPPS